MTTIRPEIKPWSRQGVDIIDLSVAFARGMPKYPAEWFPPFEVEEVAPTGVRWTRRFTSLRLFAHNGTHVESSEHVFHDGVTIGSIPLQHFVDWPVIVDLRDIPDGTAISASDVRQRVGACSPGRVLLLMTGYDDKNWGAADFWDRSPWLSPEAAEYVASLEPTLIGLDFQTEKPGERDFINHRLLVSTGAVLCEYLFNLERLDQQTLFLALPIKVDDVEAAPVRAVGLRWPNP